MLTELRPKKELLDPNFNGYKLSLDPIPVYRQNITEGVDHVTQSEDQYSFIHTKVFSLHNHLFTDPWHNNTTFFIDKTWRFRKAQVSPESGRVEGLESVWTMPNLADRKPGDFNASLVFPSPDVAVVADGCGQLHILNRCNDYLWQPECSTGVGEGASLLMSACLAADSALHCVLMSVDSANAEVVLSAPPGRVDQPKPATVNTVLLWITLTKDSIGEWSISCTRKLEGAGSVDYVALEASCTAIYIGSSASFKFTADSAKPLPPPESEVKMDVEDRLPLYTWKQTDDDVKVVVEVGAEVTRDDVAVTVTERQLSIQCKEQMIVTGTLSRPVDTDLTTWTLQPDRLEVTLSKKDCGPMWTELVGGDTRGQQELDPTAVEAVHARLSHLCSDTEVHEVGESYAPTFNLDQLEECDSAPDNCGCLARLDASNHSVSHQVSLAGHQWLLSIAQGPDCAPCVCVRHDVDGCVWRLDPPPLAPATEWPCQHIGTFSALGYVAASKQQKKFIVAAPDLSYAVICEASNHVFVYRKSSVVNGELRNRKTAAKVATVAKQQLINLECQTPVLGAQATNTHLFVLTTDMLYTFHVQ